MTALSKQPKYWELLSTCDQESYGYLQKTLSSPACKNRRNHSNETFSDILDTIKKFVIRNDENDWKRALVCGVGWIENGIAVNTRQLRLLIAKCKSSINGSFQALGYGSVPTSAETASALVKLFPFLKNAFPELRQWSVRLEGGANSDHPHKVSNVVRQAIIDNNQISLSKSQNNQQQQTFENVNHILSLPSIPPAVIPPATADVSSITAIPQLTAISSFSLLKNNAKVSLLPSPLEQTSSKETILTIPSSIIITNSENK